jgi:hypothetical protein
MHPQAGAAKVWATAALSGGVRADARRMLPENWGRGGRAGPPIHFQFTVRSALLATLAHAWFISAIFWFIRSRFE